MAVKIYRYTLGSASGAADITTINTRLNAEDAHSTAGTTNPVLIPGTGTKYSYWASTRLYFDGVGTGTINNIGWYTDGDNGLGTGIGLQAKAVSAYALATGTPGDTGTQLTGGADAFTYTSAAVLGVSGSTTDPSSEAFGNYVVLQATVGTTAGAGASNAETMTWSYDTTIA